MDRESIFDSKQYNTRRGCKYAKIPLLQKMRLFKCIVQEGMSIKKVSESLDIKYSTAKTLVRQFKDQKFKIDLRTIDNETNVSTDGNTQINRRCSYRELPMPSQIITHSLNLDNSFLFGEKNEIIMENTVKYNSQRNINRVEVICQILTKH